MVILVGMHMTQHAQVNGFIRAVAEQNHPFQTRLSLILTDFEPNRNKQAIPIAEAERIIQSAVNAPIKINFDGEMYTGHKGAKPIGPITNVYMAEDNGRQVIAGDGIIWNDIHEDVANHLKSAFAEGIGTSWEIYFEESETDSDGVEWLKGCVFAGTCIVETPAYGPNRTRLLAIAEALNDDKEESMTLNEPATNEEAELHRSESGNDVEALRTDLSDALSFVGNIYEGLWQMLDETYDIESKLAVTDMPSVAEQFNKLVAGIQKRFDALKTKANDSEAAVAELQTLKQQLAEAADKAKEEARKEALAELGITLEEKKEFYLGMEDSMFETYVADLKTVQLHKTEASIKVRIPEPTNTANGNGITKEKIRELADTFKIRG